MAISARPHRLQGKGRQALASTHANQPQIVAFWTNLKQGYDLFENTHRAPRITTRPDGSYVFSPM